MASLDTIPKDLRNLRACLVCSLLKTFDQFEMDGCENCDEFLRMRNNREQVYACTSSNFDGMIAVISNQDSWVCKWQRIGNFSKGIYAISVSGKLPNGIIRELKNRRIPYRSRDITTELGNVKEEICNLRASIKEMEKVISGAKCKSLWTKKLSDLCKVKSTLQIDLANAIELECRLKRQFDEARLAYRNAKLDEHLVNEELKRLKHFIPIDTGKAQYEKGRLEMEIQCKKNAICARDETIRSVANSITTQVMKSLPGVHSREYCQQRAARVAKKRIGKYITQSMLVLQKEKAVTITQDQLRQRRQAESLSKLKDDINGIRRSIAMKNHLRQIHEEEIAIEKEEVKKILEAQGGNPYLAEYLLAIEEKQRELQRKMLVEEQKRLLDMQREYSVIEKSKEKEETEKLKWERIWAQRALQKQLEEKRKTDIYFHLSDNEDNYELKVVDEIHEKFADQLFDALRLGLDDEDTEDNYTSTEETASNGKKLDKKPEKGKPSGPRKQLKSIQESTLPNRYTFKESVAALRHAVHLHESQKESLYQMAGTRENTKAVLMNEKNIFDFGSVPVGQKKYVVLNMANIGSEPVNLKMSVLNPYGPFSFCNALKEIPSDSYYSLKFKYQPVDRDQISHETIKIEEVGNPENFTIVTLKGNAVGATAEE